MSVSVLLITHNKVGEALIQAASAALGGLPLPTSVVTVDYKTDPELLVRKLHNEANKMDHGQGLLVLTDLFGSTPSNIASQLQTMHHVRVVAGLNLPMLIRTMNYPDLPLNKLAEKAISGGRDGVVNCSDTEAD